MSILPRLLRAFENEGLTIRTGLNPVHFGNHKEAPFTVAWKDGEVFSGHGGIALQEVMLIELLCAALDPEKIYVIGNAWGWSTIAFALASKRGRVIAVDPGEEAGQRLTRTIVEKEKLNVELMKGASPEVTPSVAEKI